MKGWKNLKKISRNKEIFRNTVSNALEEDIGSGDITTQWLLSGSIYVRARIFAQEEGVICGVDFITETISQVDRTVSCALRVQDGDRCVPGQEIAFLSGPARGILTAERVALNFLSLLSGIATTTSRFVAQLNGTATKLLDTRKTTPGLRIFEKYAVCVGGGSNHRLGLWDAILIKDNHLKVLGIVHENKCNIETLSLLLQNIRKKTRKTIEIEVETIDEFKQMISLTPDIILLDNFSLSAIRKAVQFRNRWYPSVKLESSGRITLKNVRRVAECGVEFISVGAITHSPRALDFSLEIIDE